MKMNSIAPLNRGEGRAEQGRRSRRRPRRHGVAKRWTASRISVEGDRDHDRDAAGDDDVGREAEVAAAEDLVRRGRRRRRRPPASRSPPCSPWRSCRPATISGIASGSSTRQRIWRSVMPMPRAASLTDVGHVGEADHRVAVDDLQRVGAEGDDRGVAAAPGDRQQQEEEGDAGDRVEDAGAGEQRRPQPAAAVGEQGQGEGDRRSRSGPRSRPVRGAAGSGSRSGRCVRLPSPSRRAGSVSPGRAGSSELRSWMKPLPTSPTAASEGAASHAAAPRRRRAPRSSPSAIRGTRR